ncbi:MAG: saccharopine dehydrogenase NADP-binding domain-containing protein [Chitinophagales bacterium]|nr:saccharopine dehydrogenase NADP-binding domain-containing protein [Chitinophagales bacterium]
MYGATGFTGGLVAEYLSQNVDATVFKWAIAGRNEEKLQAVKSSITALNPASADIGIIVADSSDLASLRFMAKQAKAVITTAGPFMEYGEPVVQACIAEGTHYLDITGEPAYVQNILRNYDAMAKEAGVLIINCCGFDSIPADLGAYFTAKQLQGEDNIHVDGYVFSNGTFSGGTWTSAIKAFADISKATGSSEGNGSSKKVKQPFLQKVKETGKWALPMPVIDPWMVKRSAKARKDIYGNMFSYNQYISLPDFGSVVGLLGGVGVVVLGAQLKFTRELLLNYRKSGEGPSPERRAKSFFKLTFVGKSHSRKVITTVSGGDPGYTETSKMIAESALTLLSNYNQLSVQSGVTTPAAALGDFLIAALQKKGIKFEVK